MKHVRIDVRDAAPAGASGALGAGLESHLPASVNAHSAATVTRETKSRRSWLTGGLRLVRNAAIAVAIMTLIPVSAVMLSGSRLSRVLAYNYTSKRAIAAAPMRAFTLSADLSITPMQAGLAFNALQESRKVVPGFPAIEPVSRPAAYWRTEKLAPGMFATAGPSLYSGPSSVGILEAVAKGFSPAEMNYLRALNASPIWHEYDLVTRARGIDIIGGQFKLPFGPDVYAEQRPLTSFMQVKELAYASVARAAYHMAVGQRDSAETVLRSVVSLGFAFIDNSTSAIDELIGVVIVGIGRDALHRFYVIEHDPRATLPALMPPSREAVGIGLSRSSPIPVDEVRRRLIARIDNPAAPLGERLESLRMLPQTSCTNVRDLMFGPPADVVNAIARAERTIPRYPSERALIELQARVPSLANTDPAHASFWSPALSAASVAGTVLHNPRLAECTVMLSSMGGW